MNDQNKHAYLIVVHASPYVLEKLLLLLDDERNDIYIHVDKKVKEFDFEYFHSLVKRSHLVFIERIEVYWGDISLVKVEVNLLKAAYESNKRYEYYHLISGGDLPLKSQDYIHSFFEKHRGLEFVGFGNDKFQQDRVSQLHFFTKYKRLSERAKFTRVLRWIGKQLAVLQRKLNYDRVRNSDVTFVYGSNWASVTPNFVQLLLSKEKQLIDFYKYVHCGDELFMQTLIYNSHLKDKVYDLHDELKGCQRLMDWKRGRPFTFRKGDFDFVMNSGLLFARKFDEDVDKEIIDAIFDSVVAQSNSHSGLVKDL